MGIIDQIEILLTQECTLEELQAVAKCVDKHLEAAWKKHDYDLVDRAKDSEIPFLMYLGQALLHERHKLVPSERIGYWLADHAREAGPLEGNPLYKELCNRICLSSYIFIHTHYDECHNGCDFRRS